MQPDGARGPLLVVDGDNLAHRAYHSTPRTVTGADGTPINAIVGFVGMLAGLWQSLSESGMPRAVFVAWDTLGVDTYRHRLWPAYQGGREFEPSIVAQLESLPALCREFGFGTGKRAGYEADDFMAAAALEEVKRGGTALLLTSDRDAYQLVSDHITVISPRRGTRELDRIGTHEVVARLGVLPEQVPDYKALAGDASDKIPGARGIGPKTAASLLLAHGDLDAVLTALGRHGEAEQLLAFREMVRLRTDVAVTLPEVPPDWPRGASAVRALGANALADRVLKLRNGES